MTTAARPAPVGLRRHPEDPRLPITQRQLETLRLAANGYSAEQIGKRMGIGAASVHDRMRVAFRKLGVHDRTHAVAVAIRLGLIGLDEIELPSVSSGPGVPHQSRERPRGRQNAPDRS